MRIKRTEYRVIYLNAFVLAGGLEAAMKIASVMREQGTDVKGIQKRTVIETPWEDVANAA